MVDSLDSKKSLLPTLNGFFYSLKAAIAGIQYTIRSQRNMKIHLACAAPAFGIAIFSPVSLGARLALLLCVGLVLAAELFNTAIEALVDLASPRFHPLAKVAKDAAAGAVLILAITSAVVATLIIFSLFA